MVGQVVFEGQFVLLCCDRSNVPLRDLQTFPNLVGASWALLLFLVRVVLI
jgi:hypothetical protein